jgi:aldehyde:ferredoxin oxidoreductase
VIRERIDALMTRLADAPQYPTQGATLFVDLERREVRRAWTPRAVVETFLEGRGANMFYLYNLLDPTLEPMHPEVPLQFSAGILTGIVPSAARGQATSWSPETRLLMDSNCGDYFPSYMKLQGVDRLVIFGMPERWTYLRLVDGQVEFRDATPWLGLDNLDLRQRVAAELGGTWGKDLAMASIGVSGERRVLSAAIMGGQKACWARGGTGAKMGSLRLKAVVLRGFDPRRGAGAEADRVKPYNRQIAARLLGTGVVKHALQLRGTPFLYKPSRLIGAMGALNNQLGTWTDALDAENLDPFRPGMAGCFRCPVNCRPLNDLGDPKDKYARGDGPEYVTVGKFGPLVGIKDPRAVVRLNNVCNDLCMDTASTGSAIAWAMELFQRGILTTRDTGGLALEWGDAQQIEKLMFMMSRREGFGDTLADSAAAVDTGKYPKEALDYRMAVKGLMQSDPHDARIIKAFALGLAVATRGMDHLRNRVTLEINARINDDPRYKEDLYGGFVSAKPNDYDGKEVAVRRCEDTFAVGDAVGMCRFTTRLFNSPNLPGFEEFSAQIRHVTGLSLSPADLQQVGLNITGLERMINYALGARREHDTLPRRWFEEELSWGAYAGEKIDRAQFDAMLDRFYEITGLGAEGAPRLSWRAKLAAVASGFAVEVRVPESVRRLPDGGVLVTEPVRTVKELLKALDRQVPGLGDLLDDSIFAVAVNDEVILHGRLDGTIKSGDRVEFMPAFAGG